MFTRVVAVTTKPGKVRELSKTIHAKILPMLEAQAGFVDLVLLVSDTVPNQILALSFWESQQDAERYTHEQFPAINELISHLVESAPVSRTFNVDLQKPRDFASRLARIKFQDCAHSDRRLFRIMQRRVRLHIGASMVARLYEYIRQ